jgi:predicted ATPase
MKKKQNVDELLRGTSILQSITFTKDCRGVFKAGQTVEFRPGFTALVGINGCGKSTLLEVLREEFGIKDNSYLKQPMKCADVKRTEGEAFYYDFHAGDRKYSGTFGDDMSAQLASMRRTWTNRTAAWP